MKIETPMGRPITAEKDEEKRFSWQWVLAAAFGAAVVYIPMVAYWSDVGSLLYIFVVVPMVALLLLLILVVRIVVVRKSTRLTTLWMAIAYVTVTVVLFMNYGELRPALRWLLWSRRYKAELLALPNPPKGQLKHLECDVSGWGPIGPTIEYVVFDPTNSLLAAAKSHKPGQYSGLPCEVPRVELLESHWYAVRFYTEESWGGHNRLNCSGRGN